MAFQQVPSMDPDLVAAMESALLASKEAYQKFSGEFETHQMKFLALLTEFGDLRKGFKVIRHQYEADSEVYELLKRGFDADTESFLHGFHEYSEQLRELGADNMEDATALHEQRVELYRRYREAFERYNDSFMTFKTQLDALSNGFQKLNMHYAPQPDQVHIGIQVSPEVFPQDGDRILGLEN